MQPSSIIAHQCDKIIAHHFASISHHCALISHRRAIAAHHCAIDGSPCRHHSKLQYYLLTSLHADAPHPPCTQDELRLDASGSATTSVFPLFYLWEFSPVSPNAEVVNPILLTRAINRPHANVIRLPMSTLLSGVTNQTDTITFNLALRVSTWLDTHSELAYARVEVRADAPTVAIYAPSVVVRSSSLTLLSQLRLGCVLSGRLVWQWGIASPSVTLDSLGLSPEAIGRRSLFIPANVMPVNQTVAFTFTASYLGSSNPPVVAVTSVYTRGQPLVAQIAGGSSRAIWAMETLLLDGSGSYDPDATSTPLEYEWACSTTNGSSCPALPLAEASVLVAAGSLLPGRWFVFTLTVSKPGRSASASVNVTSWEVPPSKSTDSSGHPENRRAWLSLPRALFIILGLTISLATPILSPSCAIHSHPHRVSHSRSHRATHTHPDPQRVPHLCDHYIAHTHTHRDIHPHTHHATHTHLYCATHPHPHRATHTHHHPTVAISPYCHVSCFSLLSYFL